ncbi:hypothetical protein Peur_024643 [Populus x canadensis]
MENKKTVRSVRFLVLANAPMESSWNWHNGSPASGMTLRACPKCRKTSHCHPKSDFVYPSFRIDLSILGGIGEYCGIFSTI